MPGAVSPVLPGTRPGTGGGTAADEARLRDVARDFEAIFLTHLLTRMREAMAPREAGGGAMRTYRGLADDELGRALARAGGIGLAATLSRELQRFQPGTRPGSSPTAGRPMSSSEGPTPGGPR